MTARELLLLRHRTHTSVQERRAERELFFWTAFTVIKLIVFAVLAAYVVVSLITGEWPLRDLLLRSLSSG
ncbi:MAG: hypothetical protein ABR992_12215 [Solirubrobacteraceae bacterium]